MRERLRFSVEEWDRLPWWQSRMYIEYLRDTTPGQEPPDRPDQRFVDDYDPAEDVVVPPEPAYVPGPDEVLDDADYDPAEDDAPPAPPGPIAFGPDITPPAPAPPRERPDWLPALPIKRVERFGEK